MSIWIMIAKWWRKFVKDHIIDEIDKDDPDFQLDIDRSAMEFSM